MLFVELALIRWLGANVVHLSYFSNFVLLGSFLGIGAGFLISRKEWSIWPLSLPLLAVLTTIVTVFPVTIERAGAKVLDQHIEARQQLKQEGLAFWGSYIQ